MLLRQFGTGTWWTSAVNHKNAVSQISVSSSPMHHQKSIQTRLYRRGIPNSGSTGGPGAPGPSDVRGCITQTKRHHSKLKQPGMCRKRRLDSGFPRKRDLPVPAGQVKGGKPLLPGQHIQGVVYPGKWVGIFRGRIIQLAIVNAEPGTTIFLRLYQNIRIYFLYQEPLSPVTRMRWNTTSTRATGHPFVVHHDACHPRR